MKKDLKKLQDLATLAGVSIATVSRVLADSPLVNEATKKRIWHLALSNNYPFRHYMPAGPMGADATIAIIIPRPQTREPKLSDPFILDLVASIGQAAREMGCDFLVSHVTPSNTNELKEVMETNRADGVIFLGQNTLHNEFNELSETQRNFIVWGAQLSDQKYCSIGSDNFMGGRMATDHLLKLGRKKIVFLGETFSPEIMMRYQGYLEAQNEKGIFVDPLLKRPASLNIDAGEENIIELLRANIEFDAIFAASDMLALGAIRGISRFGKNVPNDVSVIGYDDVQFAKLAIPALTTVSQNLDKAGRLLVSKLIGDKSSEMISERVPIDLKIRETCGG